MLDDPGRGSTQPRRFRLCISGYHIYVEDDAGKLARIGAISLARGELAYRLLWDDIEATGFLTAEKLLQDVAAKLAYGSLRRFVATAPAVPGETVEPVALSLFLADEGEPGERAPHGAAQ